MTDFQNVGTLKLDLLLVKETFSLVAAPVNLALLDLMVSKLTHFYFGHTHTQTKRRIGAA